MRTIKIDDEVWELISKNGKFRETDNDVLRRLLEMDKSAGDESTETRAWKQRRTTERMTQNDCQNNELVLRFDSGTTFRKKLPSKDDISEIRRVRDEAVDFVKKNGGTKGQEHAAIRALTSNGYHVSRRPE
jgi:negative regulator of replication initiation